MQWKLSHIPDDSEYCISIPSYIVRGAGKQTHYEYEIRITLQDDKWTLLRRYSKFRDLHLKMKSSYGDKVCRVDPSSAMMIDDLFKLKLNFLFVFFFSS